MQKHLQWKDLEPGDSGDWTFFKCHFIFLRVSWMLLKLHGMFLNLLGVPWISKIVLTCLKNILSKSKDDTKGEPVVFSKLLVQITYYFVMVGSVLALALVGNDPIINQRYQGNDLSLFFFLCMIKCFLMAHMTIHI